MNSVVSRLRNFVSSSSTKSNEQADSKPSPESLESDSGESLKLSPEPALPVSPSPTPSASPENTSVSSLIAQSLAIQESLVLSLEDREKDARAKAHAITWNNPLWLAARKRQADVGKEPQWLSERGAGFDKRTDPPPAPIQIAIQQVFSDGSRDNKLVTVGPEEKK